MAAGPVSRYRHRMDELPARSAKRAILTMPSSRLFALIDIRHATFISLTSGLPYVVKPTYATHRRADSELHARPTTSAHAGAYCYYAATRHLRLLAQRTAPRGLHFDYMA